ncbi:TPA: transcriptional regulator, SarA/Rot family [Staphylococcus aureus]
MKTIDEIKSTYQTLGAVNTLDKALKKTKGFSLLDIMILKTTYEHKDFIRKTEIEKILHVSPAMSQKSTKHLRKEGLIIKDRDIDDEGIIIIGMTEDMRQKAQKLFKEVEHTQQEILNGNNPADKIKKDKENENNNHTENNDKNKHNNPNDNFNKKHK